MLENIRISIQGIWSHKMRSFLTMLGIIIGIASIIAIVSTLKGTNEQIKEDLIGAGNNTVSITLNYGDSAYDQDYGMSDGKAAPLLSDEQKEEVRKLDHVENATFFYSRSYASNVYYQNVSFQGGSIYGIDMEYLETRGYMVRAGRGFVQKDLNEMRKVVLVDDNAADFHGSDRVGFLGSSCVDFEASGISRVSCFHIRYDIFCHLVKSLIFVDHDRADTYDTKYSLQSLHSLVKIIFLRTEHVYTALFLGYCKFAFYRLQSQFHLLYKGIFKKISVFSLDGDLCIFDQKCMKYHTVPPDYFLEYRLSIGTRVFMVSRK